MRNPLDIESIDVLNGAARPANILTVDVEEWYHVNYTSADWSSIDTSVSSVHENTMNILEILDRTGSKGTFFVLGCIAKKHPRLVQAIDREGHEVACHGDLHKLIYDQTPDEFRRGLREAIDSIFSQTGKHVIGFRAPSWSITERNQWALDIIAEEGFLYDSSIFPLSNYMYGIRDFPAQPCWLTTRSGKRLLEIPATAMEIGRRKIPCGGGIYLRMLPLWVQKRFMAVIRARGYPFMLYFHPSDIDRKHHKIDLSIKERFFHNIGRQSSRRKFLSLLEDHRWIAVRDAFSQHLPK